MTTQSALPKKFPKGYRANPYTSRAGQDGFMLERAVIFKRWDWWPVSFHHTLEGAYKRAYQHSGAAAVYEMP